MTSTNTAPPVNDGTIVSVERQIAKHMTEPDPIHGGQNYSRFGALLLLSRAKAHSIAADVADGIDPWPPRVTEWVICQELIEAETARLASQ